ncbi:MaoC like domain protein [Xylophilus ampelinus]|nr:MaoC family dehydratase N-terminal domain-containing protein [Variovorax sp.]VTY35511.1 MaoC like domain protein [Xylophilus ampelinus]
MLNYEVCKYWRFEHTVCRYEPRDTILYALGIGAGGDPVSPQQLRFVYEKELAAIPTLATVLGSAGMWMSDPRTGIDTLKLVHGEQHLRLHRPLPPAGTLIARHRVEAVVDKGPGKGALLVTRKELLDAADGSPVCETRSIAFLRGDGGFSAQHGMSDPAPPRLPAPPERPADQECSYTTLPQAALIYRLSGDLNALHADPEVVRRAGFDRPILHGLCTYGMAARAAIEVLLDGQAERLRAIAARFTAPVWPGETVRFEFWREGGGRVHLRARVDARHAVVLDHGVMELENAL